MPTLSTLRAELAALADPRQREILQGFFKIGPGQYAEGEVFLGIRLPVLRRLAERYRDLPPASALELLGDAVHEHRQLALLLLIRHYRAGNQEIFARYLAHARQVNNWDLVDLSAPAIVGDYLLERPRDCLYRLAASDCLWERRIAIVATLAFVRRNHFADTLTLCESLLHDRHDLIHKACGWLLREVGKRDQPRLEAFLSRHAPAMPRVMLRYAIERLPETRRKAYLRMERAKP
jgi:3-methyladenine DNA glycosylase AlkD